MVCQIIDFTEIRKFLKKKYRRRASAGSRPTYPPLQMFKLLLPEMVWAEQPQAISPL